MPVHFDNDPPVLVALIHSDPKRGAWWGLGTERGWVEIRVTPTGYIRVGEPQYGKHPYFTVKSDDMGWEDDHE